MALNTGKWFIAQLVTCSLGCQPRVTQIGTWAPDVGQEGDAVYLEAEDGELSFGFQVVDDGAASAGRCLAPPSGESFDSAPGPARAVYSFDVKQAATYLIWGRIRSSGALDNRFWFQVDGGEWVKWRLSVGDIWFWDTLHEDTDYGVPIEFELQPGSHQITFANCVPGVELDRLYITARGDTPPGNDTICNPPHTIELAGKCVESCGHLNGNICGVAACAGQTTLVAYDCDVCCRVAP